MITEITKESRMADLIDILKDASSKYYTTNDEESAISDAQYDRYLSELMHLEDETGITLSGSPTMRIGFGEPEEGKIKHYAPVLSLKDTKSVDEMLHFLGEREGILSWKLDGVSIVLHYSLGVLRMAVSRGDGHYGKEITKNVILMRGIPTTIPTKDNLIIRGEGCLSLNEFGQIKKTREGEKYSNARSMASGLINGTKTTNILLRHMNFVAHSAILLEGHGRELTTRYEGHGRELITRYKQFRYLKSLGFNVVPHSNVFNYELQARIDWYTQQIQNFEFPVDGLVLSLNDIQYGESLGATAKFPRHSLAFKWPDEVALTTVTGMKWSVSQTGLITPVVLFEPVRLEGTEVKQANLHTLKIFEELSIGIGDTLRIFKANKISPEVDDNLTRSRTEDYPRYCPICGGETTVIINDKTRKLYCYPCGGKEYFK